jgi:hypothetical protein
MIKHYGPNKKVLDHIEKITIGKKVLELGPGNTPFKNATHFCGWEHGIQPIDASKHKVCNFNDEHCHIKIRNLILFIADTF